MAILILASLSSIITVIKRIRFAWWWVWRWWVWLRVLWCMRFSLSFWRFFWSFQWRGVWRFFFNGSWVQLWSCYVCRVFTNSRRVQRWSTQQNILALKFLIFPRNFKISFIAIVLVWPCRTHSYHRCFANDMIWGRLLVYISKPSDSGSGGTEDTKFIQCLDGQEPQNHRLWCLGLYNIACEFYPTTQVLL